jgi:hypothetical protein
MHVPGDQAQQSPASPALRNGGARPESQEDPDRANARWLDEPDWDCLESSTAFEGASPQLGDDAEDQHPTESQHAGACRRL